MLYLPSPASFPKDFECVLLFLLLRRGRVPSVWPPTPQPGTACPPLVMCAGIRVSESKRDIFSGRYVCQIGRKTRTKRNRPISFGVGVRLGSVFGSDFRTVPWCARDEARPGNQKAETSVRNLIIEERIVTCFISFRFIAFPWRTAAAGRGSGSRVVWVVRKGAKEYIYVDESVKMEALKGFYVPVTVLWRTGNFYFLSVATIFVNEFGCYILLSTFNEETELSMIYRQWVASPDQLKLHT